MSVVALHQLDHVGLDAFLAQNDGEGWMLPDKLRLSEFGLGRDDRAAELQSVAGAMGHRFHDWQLSEDVVRSWEECAAHAELIRRIVSPQDPTDDASSTVLLAAEEEAVYKQGGLF